jgi:hypothetical protein
MAKTQLVIVFIGLSINIWVIKLNLLLLLCRFKLIMDVISLDKTFVKKGKLKLQGNDFLYWQAQPYLIRLAVIEQLRNEYNQWRYGTEQGFQRVYRIIKRK